MTAINASDHSRREWQSSAFGANDEGNVELPLPHQPQDVGGSALRHLDTDARMLCAVAGEHVSEKAGQGRHMQADPQAPFLAARQCASGFHGMVKLVNTGRYARNEMASGFGQPDAPRMTLEQEDAKIFFQRLDPRADAGLADAERLGGVAEVQVLGDRKRLNQGRHGNAGTEH